MKNYCRILIIFALSVVFFQLPAYVFSENTEDKIKKAIDETAKTLKKKVENINEDFHSIQEYLDHYHWKGVLQNEVNFAPFSLKDLKLNGHKKAVMAYPEEMIEGEVVCTLDKEESSSLKLYQIVIGIKGEGAQTTIGNFSKIFSNENTQKFCLRAPKKPGIYEVRFRPTEGLFETSALDSWKDEEGKEPDAQATIGLIIVR